MTLFIFLCAALVAAVCAFFVFGLRRKKSADGSDDFRRNTNIEALRTEYRALLAQRGKGEVTDEEFRETETELQRRVLDESRAGEKLADADRRQRAMTLGFVIAFLAAGSAGLYVRFGTWDAMNPAIANAPARGGMPAGHSPEEIERQLSNLEASLREHPENANGWMLLARTNEALKRYGRAAAAYSKLASLVEGKTRASVLADWADCEGVIAKGLDGKPEKLVDEALKLDPKNEKALALKGTAFYNRGGYADASKVWEKLLALQDPGTEEWQNVRNMVNDARTHGGMTPLADDAGVTRVAKSEGKAAPAEAAPAAHVSGTVTLDPALKESVSPEDTVFIFARPAEGSKMPVALMQAKASDLPVRFTLDSSMVLPGGAGGSMDMMKRVVIGARISKSGNLMPQSGDLEGATPAVAVGSENLMVRVSKKID